MDSMVLGDMLQELLDRRDYYRLHQLIVIRNKRTVIDVAFYPFARGVQHDLASIGKTLTSTLIGIAIDKGFIASVDEPVLSFFPDREIANRDARKEAMTIAHLLAQRSGIYHGDDGGHSAEDAAMEASPDWIQWILDQPMDTDPGTEYYYSNANSHLAAGVLAQATGMTPLEFAQEYLFRPLNITKVIWPADPQGINRGHGGELVMPMDLAKIGVLFLNQGDWNGQQIVSKEWVALATSRFPGPQPPGWSDEWSIGFAWVTNPELGILETAGSGGQVMRILRNENTVMVAVAGGGQAYGGCSNNPAVLNEVVYDAISAGILAQAPLPPDPQGVERLATLVEAAARSNYGPPEVVPALPARAASISGIRYEMEANPIPLYWVSLTFPGGDEALLEYQGRWPAAVRVGLDNVLRVSAGEAGFPFAAKGRWIDDDRFELVLDRVPFISVIEAEFLFGDDSVTITLRDMACSSESVTLTGYPEAP